MEEEISFLDRFLGNNPIVDVKCKYCFEVYMHILILHQKYPLKSYKMAAAQIS